MQQFASRQMPRAGEKSSSGLFSQEPTGDTCPSKARRSGEEFTACTRRVAPRRGRKPLGVGFGSARIGHVTSRKTRSNERGCDCGERVMCSAMPEHKHNSATFLAAHNRQLLLRIVARLGLYTVASDKQAD